MVITATFSVLFLSGTSDKAGSKDNEYVCSYVDDSRVRIPFRQGNLRDKIIFFLVAAFKKGSANATTAWCWIKTRL